LKKKKLGDLEK